MRRSLLAPIPYLPITEFIVTSSRLPVSLDYDYDHLSLKMFLTVQVSHRTYPYLSSMFKVETYTLMAEILRNFPSKRT